ncbi:MAG: hypothetical protein KF868_08175 [Acidobacteria bacterium]|nr:hypothetical protein [Acidobacteriota bacterium]
MIPFPGPDPIPLPAPIWLFKSLHIVTLSLHFVAVHLLTGGLLLAAWWNFLGRKAPDSTPANASGAIAKRLPIVMTYLINLGVPPLLFAQVLYGRALYTSSVLIGAYWISVIFLLMFGYFLLYRVADRAERGRTFWPLALLSLVAIAYIGRIYSANMTLMLRPEVWSDMYGASPLGAQLPDGDPTLWPRWLFMMVGSAGIAGIFIAAYGAFANIRTDAAGFLRRQGGYFGAAFILLQIAIGYRVFGAQPAEVQQALMSAPLSRYCVFIWLAVSALLIAIGAWTAIRPEVAQRSVAAMGALLSVIATIAAVTVRDGIRDATLAAKGLDVWDQAVTANWSVVAVFLVLFVAGLAAIGWMAWAAMSAKGETQHV